MDDFDDVDRFRSKPHRTGWGMRIGVGGVLLVFAGFVAWGAISLLHADKPTKRQVVQISLLKAPPPPSPPPPERLPEPEVPKEEVKMPEPEQQPEPARNDTPPPGEQLGLDADGSGNGDSFGLAARKGGTEITKLGGSGGLGRDRASWFGGLVQSHLQAELLKNEKLRTANYSLLLRVWFDDGGRIDRFELVNSTGNSDMDESIRLALDHMPAMRQAPPPDVPQPLKLQITSRGAG
ncbi:MAG: TonB C-terminal domain-containing protein [Betaproteobacteria bacterium]